MTQPVNLYTISRIHDEEVFNAVELHQSQRTEFSKTKCHELESLRLLVDNFIQNGITLEKLDGFFFGFHIPLIGKEFDLLKITDKLIFNIELKSQEVAEEQILNQLRKNRHYLNHLGKKLLLYTVVTNTMTCYKLSINDELVKIDFGEILRTVDLADKPYTEDIDKLFVASKYLVSPINTPEKFIQGEYFLTQSQEHIKKQLLTSAEEIGDFGYFHITGTPGTGKTLLLYDIAKTLSRSGKTVVIHCADLPDGLKKIDKDIENLSVISHKGIFEEDLSLNDFSYILVDESHRMPPSEFEKIRVSAERNEQICIFSSDPEQVLSTTEKKNGIVGKIRSLNLTGEYNLSEKIRMNKELHSFILSLRNLNHKAAFPFNYTNVSLNYANTTQEAQNLIGYYRRKGYVFINYSKSNTVYSPYSEFEEDYDTHQVIGQEFDRVVMLMDKSFYYDEDGILEGIPYLDPDYLYPNLFYQGITRVREKLALIVVDAPFLFKDIISIIR